VSHAVGDQTVSTWYLWNYIKPICIRASIRAINSLKKSVWSNPGGLLPLYYISSRMIDFSQQKSVTGFTTSQSGIN